MTDGACKRLHIDTNIFFPVQGTDPSVISFAKGICNICIVQPICLQYAINENMRGGIWGGLTDPERSRIVDIPLPSKRQSAHG